MPHRQIPPLPTRSRQQARQLRAESTEVEAGLWYRLRSGRLAGYKFRRQYPIPPYVADFCCISAKLVVELDGSQHGDDCDAARRAFIESHGYRVIRFWNNQVVEDMEGVLAAILDALQDPTLTPVPSPKGRGESEERGNWT